MSLPASSSAGTLSDDLGRLRGHLDALAESSDDELMRYELSRPPMPPGFYWQLRWIAGRTLRWLESLYLKQREPFPPGLKTAAGSARAKPLLIWAIGPDRETLRASCRGFAGMRIAASGFAPVLVTDVADFAFFSRLGWLVEYVPALTGEGQPYGERKARFLARLYRGAPALPASAARASWEEIRACLASAPAHRKVLRSSER